MTIEEVIKQIKILEEAVKNTKDDNERLSIQYEIERLKNLPKRI